MYLASLQLGISLLWGATQGRAVPISSDSSGGITITDPANLTPGWLATTQNLTSFDLDSSDSSDSSNSSNSTVGGPMKTDTWHIDGTTLTLKLDVHLDAGVPQNQILNTLREALREVKDNPPDEELAEEYVYDNKKYNVFFTIEPTVSRVLAWKDVVTCIDGLKNYYTIVRDFVEVRYGLEEDETVSERGRFAQGGMIKRHPTPPPSSAK